MFEKIYPYYSFVVGHCHSFFDFLFWKMAKGLGVNDIFQNSLCFFQYHNKYPKDFKL